jgi:hypothetical protein
MLQKLDPNSSHFKKALAHVLGKSVNYDYLYSNARVKMGGPHPEEELGQLLMMDRNPSPVTLDKDFRPSLVYSTKSPYFRQGRAPQVANPSSAPNHIAPARKVHIRDEESEKESESDSESESDVPKPILGKR